MTNVKVGGGHQVGVMGQVEAQDAPRAKGNQKVGGALQPELRAVTKEEIQALGGAKLEPKKVRVRFAPSPTGHLHIGGARTALMNYLFAKKMGGEFLLRIEDTDQMRSKPEYTQAIIDGMQWLGMKHDGDIMFQSQRADRYNGLVDNLIAQGKAYVDQQSGAVFFRMPQEGTLTVQDRVKGAVTINVVENGTTDYVIRKSDGSPSFLFANVVDDVDMGITHVLRGDDHLTNAAKQIPLYRALGADPPEFYHMPLIHGDSEVDAETGKVKAGGKLSKRHGATSVIDYQQLGYDAQVFMNHLARMGMRFESESTMPIEELSKQFDPLRLSKSPSTLGMERLDARMMMHIKRAPVGELVAELKNRIQDPELLKAHIEDPGTDKRAGFFERTAVKPEEAKKALAGLNDTQLTALADGAKARAHTFAEMLDMLIFVRAEPAHLPEEKPVYAHADAKKVMTKLLAKLDQVPADQWTHKSLERQLDLFNGAERVKYSSYGNNLRWMLTGVADGMPLQHTMAVIGRDETLRRLRAMTE